MPFKPNHLGSLITEFNNSFGNFTTLPQLEHKFTIFNTNHNKEQIKIIKLKIIFLQMTSLLAMLFMMTTSLTLLLT